MATKLSFESWRKEVDNLCWENIGCSESDLPDWDSWNMWDSGDSPEEAVETLMEENNIGDW